MELQRRYDDIKAQGLGLIAVSYDTPETLKTFADRRGITFPMVSDHRSVIIKQYGLLNETMDPKTPYYGVPYPGTFLLDTNGVVTARYFEDAYQERNTVASILARQGLTSTGGIVSTSNTVHVAVSASVSDADVAPGKRISLVFDVAPKTNMHVYAPGKHAYQVIRVVLDPQPWLKVHATRYPASEVYELKALNERVEVYSKPFRLVQDVTILATGEAQRFLNGTPTVTLAGTLEYQACDDRVAYAREKLPVSFTLTVKGLDR